MKEDEYALLESQLIRDGCLDALKVWDRGGEQVLLDGHNRLAICKNHNILYDTSTIAIESIDEAIIWIVDNQKARRNLATQEEVDYISGRRYEAQTNIDRTRDDRGRFKSPSDENGLMDNAPAWGKINPTAYKQSVVEGVGMNTIKHNAIFARGVDAVRQVSPGLAERILKPAPDMPRLTKKTVMALPKLDEKDHAKFVEAVQDINRAIETKDKKVLEMVVRDHVTPDEPTHEEKIIAKRYHVKPEHIRYANDHGIAYNRLMTVDQLAELDATQPAMCSTMWDGIYGCSDCGIKFELFGSEHAPMCCPHCESENIRRPVR